MSRMSSPADSGHQCFRRASKQGGRLCSQGHIDIWEHPQHSTLQTLREEMADLRDEHAGEIDALSNSWELRMAEERQVAVANAAEAAEAAEAAKEEAMALRASSAAALQTADALRQSLAKANRAPKRRGCCGGGGRARSADGVNQPLLADTDEPREASQVISELDGNDSRCAIQ